MGATPSETDALTWTFRCPEPGCSFVSVGSGAAHGFTLASEGMVTHLTRRHRVEHDRALARAWAIDWQRHDERPPWLPDDDEDPALDEPSGVLLPGRWGPAAPAPAARHRRRPRTLPSIACPTCAKVIRGAGAAAMHVPACAKKAAARAERDAALAQHRAAREAAQAARSLPPPPCPTCGREIARHAAAASHARVCAREAAARAQREATKLSRRAYGRRVPLSRVHRIPCLRCGAPIVEAWMRKHQASAGCQANARRRDAAAVARLRADREALDALVARPLP